MGKYSSYQKESKRITEEERTHPIWRGIGFIYMLLTPVLGWFGALVLLEENANQGWMRIPRDMLAPGRDPQLYVKIGLAIVIMFLLFVVFQLITFIVYRAFGPSRYGPMDVPPVAFRGKRKSR